jgi:uncharacterized membrane protein
MAFSPDESSTGLAPTTAAGLASLFGVFGAIFFTFAERSSHFVWLYIHQSYRIFILAFLGEVIFGVGKIMGDVGGMGIQAIGGLLLLAYVICLVTLAVNAFQGKVLALPVFGAGLKRKLKITDV